MEKKDIKLNLCHQEKGCHHFQLEWNRGNYKNNFNLKCINSKLFSDPSICLAIDELDAGIFEYILGELLQIFDESAKGQLIFTSHNLRALEMLEKESIMFSTTNSSNQYIHMKNIKQSNNLRDVYLRSITLGGQKEEIYKETSSLKIARAFRRAGRCVKNNE